MTSISEFFTEMKEKARWHEPEQDRAGPGAADVGVPGRWEEERASTGDCGALRVVRIFGTRASEFSQDV